MSSTLHQETTPDLPSPLSERTMPPLRTVAAVAAGGMIGAVLRVGFAETFPALPGRYPWTTFVENIIGSFLLGLLLTALLERWRPGRDLRPFLATGVLGSFTTFSNYTGEIFSLGAGNRADLAVIYALVSIVAGLVAAALGMMIARRYIPDVRKENA